MNKKRSSLLLAIFFLAQGVISSPLLSFEGSILNPPTNIDAAYSDPTVKKIYDAVCLGVLLYELDAIAGKSRAEIEMRYHGLAPKSEARFDLANMDQGRKGWTRCYPFSIGNKSFIMRIFLTSERSYQSPAPVLYEGTIANPAVTFQILPSINDILAGCAIKPRAVYSHSEVNHSS